MKMSGNDLLARQLKVQHRHIIALANSINTHFAGSAPIKATQEYKHCAALIALLSPMDVRECNYIRLGRINDGGYVMLDDFEDKIVEAAYSFGISGDVSWDMAFASRGVDVFMYDHTIDRIPGRHPRFHYFKLGVTGRNRGPLLKTLAEIIADNGHASHKNMILKMDVEGCEWDVLNQTSPEVLNQFLQIVVEFHGLTSFPNKDTMVSALGRLNQTHQSIHVHANSVCTPLWIGGLVLPNMLEVTYVRRNRYNDRLTPNTRVFPTAQDMPSYKELPDLPLGLFRTNDPG